ncbi:NTP transferase domain-containing protein [Erythrobacter aquimaris]|uniref:NTP transferase domain-containing protein n=1 Tax=Qipengyuania aquimaris TaxID=255984 RepID=A0A6I4TKJ3_9SPHN|nr:nucleotidyltransferase family protein [Qipengyuania aquimaris]MXO96485.1 NTP transferase domain-containing protein [Qipengyuania aquimaris]
MTPLDPGTALILLAAGRSERFGGDKLAADYRGRQLWTWAARAAEKAGFQHLYIVMAPHSSIAPDARWNRVLNAEAERGMGTSIAAGLAAAQAHDRVVIALADMPRVTASHLRMLAQASGPLFTRQSDGKAGCPAAFDSASFAELRELDGDRGARILAGPDVNLVEPAAADMLVDIDRRSELDAENAR